MTRVAWVGEYRDVPDGVSIPFVGVWAMSETLRLANQNALNATPTAARTVLFYDALLGPTFAAAGSAAICRWRHGRRTRRTTRTRSTRRA